MVEDLKFLGVESDKISVVFPEPPHARGQRLDMATAAPDGAVEGIARTLEELGMPRHQARSFAQSVRDGSILVSAHTEHADIAQRVKDIFRRNGASDVCVADEPAATDSSSGADYMEDSETATD